MNNNFRGSILRVSKYGNLREGRNQNLREEQVSTASSKKSNKKMAMNDDKMTGAGAERRETSTTNHPGRGNGTNKKKQGTQGRGGRGGRGFFTPPRPRRSSRILQQDERDETKADVTTESEARSMVASLIPYFRYEFGDDIQKLFKPDAWEMHLEAKWDPELRVAVTPDDSRVDGLKDQDAEYQWEEVKEMEIEHIFCRICSFLVHGLESYANCGESSNHAMSLTITVFCLSIEM